MRIEDLRNKSQLNNLNILCIPCILIDSINCFCNDVWRMVLIQVYNLSLVVIVLDASSQNLNKLVAEFFSS